MHLRKIAGFVVATGLVACSGAFEQESVGTKELSVAQTASDPGVSSSIDPVVDSPVLTPADELPGDACTREGYWSFFETFVRSHHVREKYTAPEARGAIDPFRIALVDDRWYYVEAGQEPGQKALELKEIREANSFTVEYTKADLGPDGEVVKRYGAPEKYVFQFTNGCWQLASATR